MSYTEAAQGRGEGAHELEFSVFEQKLDFGASEDEQICSDEVTCLNEEKIIQGLSDWKIIEKLNLGGKFGIFEARFEHLHVLCIELEDDEARRQEGIYACHGHRGLLKFLFLLYGETSCVKLVFEYQVLKSLIDFLESKSIELKISTIFKISEIFLYFESKGVIICPSLEYFCIDENDNPILINLKYSEESFLMAPETLAFGIRQKETSSWALGIIIAEILTDKHPFSEESFKFIRQERRKKLDSNSDEAEERRKKLDSNSDEAEERRKKLDSNSDEAGERTKKLDSNSIEAIERRKYLNFVFGKEFNISDLEKILRHVKFQNLIIMIRDLMKPLAKDRASIDDLYKEIKNLLLNT